MWCGNKSSGTGRGDVSDVTRWEGESNGRGMGTYANRVKCGVVERVKRNITLS